MDKPYMFEALPSDDHYIRLLRVLSGQSPDDVAVSLVIVKMADAIGTYDAVSYTWGSPDNQHRIQVHPNAGYITVRDNIWRFLKHARDSKSNSDFDLLWIDSICIDQMNLQEKSSQVSRMRQVFVKGNAKRVLIWLDKLSESETILPQDIALIRQAHLRNKKRGVERNKTVASELFRSVETHETASVARLSKYLSLLAHHPYWFRLWIVQELYAAHDNFHLIAGKVIIDSTVFSVLAHGMWDLYLQQSRITSADPQLLQTWNILQALDTSDTATDTMSNKPELEVSAAIASYGNFNCENVRDRVYGLLGVLKQDCPAASMPIDYGIEIWDLFLRVVDYILAEPLVQTLNLQLERTMHLMMALEFTSTDAQTAMRRTDNNDKLPFMSSPSDSTDQQSSSIPRLDTFAHRQVSLSISAPFRIVRRSFFRRLYRSQSDQLVGTSAHADARKLGRRYRLWLRGYEWPFRLCRHQLWICWVGRDFPLALRPTTDNTLDVIGFMCLPSNCGFYQVERMADGMREYFQIQVEEHVEHFKASWRREEEPRIAMSVLEVMQTIELGYDPTLSSEPGGLQFVPRGTGD